MIEIKQASILHLEALLPLFMQYREFHQVPAAKKTSREFMKKRLTRNDSIIWIAFVNQTAAGFVQVYPSFSSVALQPQWLLNDLFVEESSRKNGVAKELIKQVEKSAKQQGIFSIKLATSNDNKAATSLYGAMSYQPIDTFAHFTKRIE